MQADLVLVTGATGRIGRVVVADLLERGFRVRATTSKMLSNAGSASDGLEWRNADFSSEVNYGELVQGCGAIIHLAAELGKKDRMEQVNARATRLLAKAAEQVGVKVFCYASTVSVYGSGLSRELSETSPVLTATHDVASEYWALDYVRAYGRSKLCGELSLQDLAQNTCYFIFRPTVVVSLAQIIGVREWSAAKRFLGSHRHAHHIYDRDVSDAMIWFMQRGLKGDFPPGKVEIFNLSEDGRPKPRHIDFMKRAYLASGDRRYLPVSAPAVFDWLHDVLRFRSLPLRNPLWRMRFSSEKLMEAGYRFRYGMANAENQALAILKESGDMRALPHSTSERPA
jgi:nucleoside-diphosphate-sugar epimerase